MGMDAKARIFYGYKHCIHPKYNDDSNEYILNEDHLQLVMVNDYNGEACIAIKDSYRYFDWDYGVQPINPQQMFENEKSRNYYRLVKQWLKDNDVSHEDSDIGWFVVCDYS